MAEKQIDRDIVPLTEQAQAPVTAPVQEWVMPRQKQVERQGGSGSHYVVHYPQVRGGVCEYCGVMDPNQPSQYQYKLCPHYRGMNLGCSYCPQSKDSDDVNYHSTLNITEHPENPDKIVICCDSYECTKKHEERFKVSL